MARVSLCKRHLEVLVAGEAWDPSGNKSKWGLLQKKQQAQNGVSCAKLISLDQGLRPNLIAISAFPSNVVLTCQSGLFWSALMR